MGEEEPDFAETYRNPLDEKLATASVEIERLRTELRRIAEYHIEPGSELGAAITLQVMAEGALSRGPNDD